VSEPPCDQHCRQPMRPRRFFAQKSACWRCFRLSDFSLKLLPAHKFHSVERLFEHLSLSTHASFRVQLWIFMQAGQRSRILRFAAKDSNTIVSVVSPVGTFRPRIGQRIMMFGKEITLRFAGRLAIRQREVTTARSAMPQQKDPNREEQRSRSLARRAGYIWCRRTVSARADGACKFYDIRSP
jgi:hypothetical protein